MKKTINLSLPQTLLKFIDVQAKKEYRSRSEFIREASVQYLQNRRNRELIQADLASRAQKLGIKTETDIENLVDSGR